MEIPKVTPFLMFNNQAEEAVNLYTSLFKNSEILTMVKYGRWSWRTWDSSTFYFHIKWSSIHGDRCR